MNDVIESKSANSKFRNNLQNLFFKLRQTSVEAENKKSNTEFGDPNSNVPLIPYLFLIQHSQSFQLRHVQSAFQQKTDYQKQLNVDHTTTDTIYKFAGLRTPVENAIRDSVVGELFLNYILEAYCGKNDNTSLIWVQTIPLTAVQKETIQEQCNHQCHFINCCQQNSFGWNEIVANDDDIPNLENIPSLLKIIKNAATTTLQRSSVSSCAIVIQSLNPIFVRHGFNIVRHFLNQMIKINTNSENPSNDSSSNKAVPVSTIIIPIIKETFTPNQNCELECIANAVLCCSSGEATLMRQGVRERSNVIREEIIYTIETKMTNHNIHKKHLCIHSNIPVKGSVKVEPADTKTKTNLVAEDDYKDQRNQSTGSLSIKHRTGKVTLSFEHDNQDDDDDDHGERKSKPNNTVSTHHHQQQRAPLIIVEDDDPEFDDYDEDDPDEDLDI